MKRAKKATTKRKTKAKPTGHPLIPKLGLKKKTGKKKKKQRKFRIRLLRMPEPDYLETIDEETEEDSSVLRANPEIIGDNEGVYCLKLGRNSQVLLECVIGKDLLIGRNWKYVKRDKIVKDIERKGWDSQFHELKEALEVSKKEHVLVIFDKNLLAKYLFISVFPKSHLWNLSFQLMNSVTYLKRGQRRILRDLWHFRSSKAKKIAKTIIKERLTVARTKIKVIHAGDVEEMEKRGRNFSSVEAKDLEGGYMNNLMRKRPSEEEIKEVKESIDSEDSEEDYYDWAWGVKDFNVQASPEMCHHFTQTFPAGTANKSVQAKYACIKSKKSIYRTYGKVLLISDECIELLSSNLKENNRVSSCPDFYQGQKCRCESGKTKVPIQRPLKLGLHRDLTMSSFTRSSFKIIFDDNRYESVSCIAWHPVFIDVAAIAYRCTIPCERGYYYFDFIEEDRVFSIFNIPEYDIIEWKLSKNPPQPMRVIYCDCEVRHLRYNVDYPSLLAGANSLGQIILWDMNKYSIPESTFISYMSSIFSSEVVPWIYIPPSIAYITIESCEVYSHRGEICDMEWVPSNSRMTPERSIDVSGKVRSGLIVTASVDGTVGVWDFQFPHPVSKNMKYRKWRVSQATPDVPPFSQYDRHMQPIQYVLSTMGGYPVPVTAVSVNNMRQWVVPGRHRTNYFSYKSMKNALIKQRPMMHACITAGLANGQIIGMFPDLEYYVKKRDLDDPDFYKDLYYVPKSDAFMQYQCFKHEGVVVCLKRSHFADDVMLSVSEESFCVWKEQSRIYKERKKNMPWLSSWYGENVHAPPSHCRILPICWKRMPRDDCWYTNGEWSPFRASQLFLLLSNGEVEVYDLSIQEEGPHMNLYVGIDRIDCVLPFICSTKTEDIALIENQIFYLFKLPDTCKHRNIGQFKYLQQFGSHEAWRRSYYDFWGQRFNEDNATYVQERLAEIKGTLGIRRFERIRRVYNIIRLRKAKEIKALRVFKDKYYNHVPEIWWNRFKNKGVMRFLNRKKFFLNWYAWEDIIDGLTDAELLLFDDLYEPRREVYKPFERNRFEVFSIRAFHTIEQFFQLYWEVRHEQTHMYDHLYKETDKDKGIPIILHYKSKRYKHICRLRQKDFGMLFEFIGYYDVEKIRDLGRIKERKGMWKFGAQEQLACRTMFTKHMNYVHKKKLNPTFLHTMHESKIPGACPPMNQVLEVWDLYGVTGRVPDYNFIPKKALGRRDAFDLYDF